MNKRIPYNLSSIAVAPIRIKSCSISAATVSTLDYLSSKELRAILYLCSHERNSVSETSLIARTNVLSPSAANSSICLTVYTTNLAFEVDILLVFSLYLSSFFKVSLSISK